MVEKPSWDWTQVSAERDCEQEEDQQISNECRNTTGQIDWRCLARAEGARRLAT